MHKVKFKEWDCIVQFAKYANNNRTAIELIHATEGDSVAMATINVPDEELEEDEVVIKDYSENEGMFEALVNANIISESVYHVATGMIMSPVCKLLVEPK